MRALQGRLACKGWPVPAGAVVRLLLLAWTVAAGALPVPVNGTDAVAGDEQLDDYVVALQHQLDLVDVAHPNSSGAVVDLDIFRGSVEDEDPFDKALQHVEDGIKCRGLEEVLQKLYKNHCNVNRKVTCVWGDTDYCPVGHSDHCNAFSKFAFTPLSLKSTYTPKDMRCGYVPDNAFVKFSSYNCKIRTLLPPSGNLYCSVSLTPLAMGIIGLFWGAVAASSIGFCCLVVHVRRKVPPEHMMGTQPLQQQQQQQSQQPQPQQQPQESLPERTKLLLAAAQRGDAAGVASALQAGVGVNVRSSANATPLISAAQFGHLQVVEDLLKAGADPNLATDAGNTAVLLAAFRGHLEVVKLLARWGADLRARNSQGWSAVDVPGVKRLFEHAVRI